MCERGLESASGLFLGQCNPIEPRLAQRVPRRDPAGLWKLSGFLGEYIWKYTHNGYDFSVLGATPITFPVEWNNSKIPGYAGRISVPNLHGFSGLVVFSSVAARFFTPQIGGAGTVPSAVGPFRIDHDEKFNMTRTCSIPAVEERAVAGLQLEV